MSGENNGSRKRDDLKKDEMKEIRSTEIRKKDWTGRGLNKVIRREKV